MSAETTSHLAEYGHWLGELNTRFRQWHLFNANSSLIGQHAVAQLAQQPVSQLL